MWFIFGSYVCFRRYKKGLMRSNMYKHVLDVSIQWLKTIEGLAVAEAQLKTSQNCSQPQPSFKKKTWDLLKSNTHNKSILVCALKLVCTSEILHKNNSLHKTCIIKWNIKQNNCLKCIFWSTSLALSLLEWEVTEQSLQPSQSCGRVMTMLL